MQEVELKFLDIDVEDIKRKITEIWAVLKFDREMESCLLIKEWYSWWDSTKNLLRVRKIGHKSVVTYKDPMLDSKMTSREEVEFETSDYWESVKLFQKMWFTIESINKKRRIHYELTDSIHFELDTLEWIPTYLEIETQSEDEMIEICKRLELDIWEWKKGTIFEILPEKK